MTFDPSSFFPRNALDASAVRNVLSSETLFWRAREAGVVFCCTKYVEYECLAKKGRPPAFGEQYLRDLMRALVERGAFETHGLSIEDLQERDILASRKKMGLGELSTLAFTKGKRLAFMSDDQRARKFAAEMLPGGIVQTTPHLLGWLTYRRKISPAVRARILSDHEKTGGGLSEHLGRSHDLARGYREMADSSAGGPPGDDDPG
jgi:hypothetical protein